MLAHHFRERERWFAFKDARLERRVLDWLASEDVEPIIESPPVEKSDPPPPSERARLIAKVLPFVRAASKLPGVLRIALIGSLITDEPNPKDVDLSKDLIVATPLELWPEIAARVPIPGDVE